MAHALINAAFNVALFAGASITLAVVGPNLSNIVRALRG